ncbi:MAG: LysR family transcriptional regulator [Pseudomonadota bacterium]
MHTKDYRLLHFFAEIVAQRSITRAAERLNVSAPVVSQALSELEGRVGVTLVQRGPRQFDITEAGLALVDDARIMQLAAERALARNTVVDHTLHAEFTLTLPSELSVDWLPDCLAGFRVQCPNVTVHVHVDDQPVDLGRSSIDLALRTSFVRRSVTDTDDPLLMPLALVQPVRDRQPSLEAALARWDFVGFAARGANRELYLRERETGEERSMAIQTAFIVNHGATAAELVKRGLGMALVLGCTSRPGIRDNTLAPVSDVYDYGGVEIRPLFRDPLPNPGASLFADFIQQFKADERPG